ncbi:MAG TPA: hypothetical protein VFO41_06565 [Alphaproteobacteria bacterium]|nr:hypothetical protein [Alphaproteobacteria bacterium]
MIDELLNAGMFRASPLDRPTHCFLADLVNRYRLGLPAVLDASRNRPLLTEHLLNEDLDLAEFEHPAVLAAIAVGDPFAPNAMAGAARLLPRLADLPDAGAMLASAIGRQSRHDQVRDGVAMAVEYGLSDNAFQSLRWLARRSLDDDRHAARRELVSYLDALMREERDPVRLIDDLLAFEYRLSLSPALFRQLLVNLVESQKMPVAARIRVVREIHRLPQSIRLELATRVSLLPPTTRANLAVKRALEDVMNRIMSHTATRRRDRSRTDDGWMTVGAAWGGGGAGPRLALAGDSR